MAAQPMFVEDQALINQALAGHADCFTALMDRHLVAVRKQIHSMLPNGIEIDDVLQDVQLKTWRHLSSFRSDSSFRTWITRIAMNEALMTHRRTKYVCQTDEMTLMSLPASSESPYQSCARLEMAEALRRAIHRLPDQFQEVLILRDLRELSIKETAQHLKAHAGLVKTRLFRARNMLAKLLQPGARVSRPLTLRDE
jgi:RNA polymerase sigma-70 factor (ECF subfamily)